MALTASYEVLLQTQRDAFQSERQSATRSLRLERDGQTVRECILASGYAREDYEDLMRAAASVGDQKLVRAVESILASMRGQFDRPVSSFKAFQSVLLNYLRHEATRGWIYVRGRDGMLYPELVVRVTYNPAHSSQDTPTVSIATLCYGLANDDQRLGMARHSHTFTAADVSRKRVADILAARGIFKETAGLHEDHQMTLDVRDKLKLSLGLQLRVNGSLHASAKRFEALPIKSASDHRVIFDMDADDYGPLSMSADSELFSASEDGHQDGCAPVPEHPLVRVFDLRLHEFYWVNASLTRRHEYDQSLRDKLILPPSHHDLLDVLTSDLSAFVDDVIEGKSAGNVILCKGIPGVGKTLTAEVYAELTERPLYSVHAGMLGTNAENINKGLSTIFARAKRWQCVLLLDEADVFVSERSSNIHQNAIVAEFLRAMEYFDGLLFMTTNRSGDIDEAIISRCGAIIDYQPPTPDQARRVWSLMAEKNGVVLDETLIDRLIHRFPGIVQRDIRNLMRLTLRMSKARNLPLDEDLFRRCAMFRAVRMTQEN